MKKGMKTGIVLLLVAVAVVAAFRLLRKDSKPKTAYNSATVRRGTLVPQRDRHRYDRADHPSRGRHAGIGHHRPHFYVDYNSIVKKGEVIAEIDRSTLEAELESSTATLESNKTEYEYQEKSFARIKGLHGKRAWSAIRTSKRRSTTITRPRALTTNRRPICSRYRQVPGLCDDHRSDRRSRDRPRGRGRSDRGGELRDPDALREFARRSEPDARDRRRGRGRHRQRAGRASGRPSP